MLAGALAVTQPDIAEARIACDGAYQLVRGQYISSPYCQDNNLAQVARSYGMRVSGDAVRNSPSVKARVCRFIGHDIRVSQACVNSRDTPMGPGLRF